MRDIRFLAVLTSGGDCSWIVQTPLAEVLAEGRRANDKTLLELAAILGI